MINNNLESIRITYIDENGFQRHFNCRKIFVFHELNGDLNLYNGWIEKTIKKENIVSMIDIETEIRFFTD